MMVVMLLMGVNLFIFLVDNDDDVIDDKTAIY